MAGHQPTDKGTEIKAINARLHWFSSAVGGVICSSQDRLEPSADSVAVMDTRLLLMANYITANSLCWTRPTAQCLCKVATNWGCVSTQINSNLLFFQQLSCCKCNSNSQSANERRRTVSVALNVTILVGGDQTRCKDFHNLLLIYWDLHCIISISRAYRELWAFGGHRQATLTGGDQEMCRIVSLSCRYSLGAVYIWTCRPLY